MGANPMQKIKRNSILIGLIIGLVIGLIMCAGLYMILNKNGGTTLGGGKNGTTTVCVLNKTIKAGNQITQADIVTKNVSKDASPADATMQIVGSVAKIDLSAGTIISSSMINANSEQVTADLREQEYNMIALPTKLEKGDFIDIRLQLPNGGDYIVVSKKKILNCDASTIWLNMNEEEIELMSSAIIEYYIMAGSKLYATTYTEPGIQTAAVGTYVPSSEVVKLITSNPDIKNYVNSERYSEALRNIRSNSINAELNKHSETAAENIEKNMQEEIKALKESRETYFGTLNSAK